MSEFIQSVSAGISQFDERYGHLRIVDPQREDVIRKSMGRQGQLVPVVAVEREDRLAVVDGFKRLRAAQKVCLPHLEVRVLSLSEQASVALVYGLNRHRREMSEFEQALVVRSLCRDHRLSQSEVAELLGHHKSWVCRRLSFVEQLDEQVQQDLRVGLVSLTVARELLRLPRGNQAEVAQTVCKQGLTSREASLLVALFEKCKDREAQKELLAHPVESLAEIQAPRPPPHDPRLSVGVNRLRRRLVAALNENQQLSTALSKANFSAWTEAERTVLEPLMKSINTVSLDQAKTSSALLESSEALYGS